MIKLPLQTLEYVEGIQFSRLRALTHSFPCSTFFGKEKTFYQRTPGGCCNRLYSSILQFCRIKWRTVLSENFSPCSAYIRSCINFRLRGSIVWRTVACRSREEHLQRWPNDLPRALPTDPRYPKVAWTSCKRFCVIIPVRGYLSQLLCTTPG